MAKDPQPLLTGQTAYWPYGDRQQNTWSWPVTWTYGTTTRQYANRVVVERGEHDATVRFYRDGENHGSLVAEVTVPLALLAEIATEPEADNG